MFALNRSAHRLACYATAAYLIIPIGIFFAFWMQPWIAAGVVALSIASVFLCLKKETTEALPSISISAPSLCLLLGLLAAWCYLSGIGGFAAQCIDYHYRNAVFRDLINHPWPVFFNVDGSKMLFVYYFTFWLPAAAVAKVFGAQAGEIFLLIWAFIGTVLLVYHVSFYLKRYSLAIPLGLIFFSSGCDIIPYFLKTRQYHFYEHLEWWFRTFQYSSLTTCLFWVFNQTIPTWVGTAFVLNVRSIYTKFLIAALVYPFAPFGFIGLAFWLFLFYGIKALNREFPDLLDGANSIPKVLALFIIVITAMGIMVPSSAFFSTTGTGMTLHLLSDYSVGTFLWRYPIFMVCDFLVMALLIAKITERDRAGLYASMAALLLIPFVQIVSARDFIMRASMPAILVLGIYACGIFMDGFGKCSRRLKIGFIVFFILCALTPLSEINRSIYRTISLKAEGKSILADDIKSLEHPQHEAEFLSNFRSANYQNSFYMKHLSPRRSTAE